MNETSSPSFFSLLVFFLFLNRVNNTQPVHDPQLALPAAIKSNEVISCPPHTYYASFLPGCADCPDNCNEEAPADIENCRSACNPIVARGKKINYLLEIVLPVVVVGLLLSGVPAYCIVRRRRREEADQERLVQERENPESEDSEINIGISESFETSVNCITALTHTKI